MTDDEKTIQITEDDLQIPLVKILTGRGFTTGKSGSGKSNTAGKICEEILDEGYPLLVIDTEGEYYGLKEEYELLHVGADEECDLQVGAEHAEKIAELALEQNVPIILDVSGYIDTEEVNQLVHDTVKSLFDKEKKLKMPFPILVEEAHEWIPQQGSRGEDGEVTDMLIRVGKRGRKRGLGLCALSQRPQSVDKDYITQCDYRIWHKLDWETELNIVKRVLGGQYTTSVSNLQPGQGYVEADFLEFDHEDEKAKKVRFLRKKTFDAGATPDLEDFERPELKSVSGDLVDELQEISDQKQREQDRIAQLEQQLEAKEEEIDDLEDEVEQAQQISNMAEKFQENLMNSVSSGSADDSAIREKLDELREEKNERIRELESERDELESELSEVRESRQELQKHVEDLEEYEQAVQHMDELREGVKRMSEALGLDVDWSDEQLKKKLQKKDERIKDLEQKLKNTGDQNHSDFIGSDRYKSLLKNIANRSSGKKEKYDSIIRELSRGPSTKVQLSNVSGLAQSTLKSRYIPALKRQGWITKSGNEYALSEEVEAE
jgi:prefoldin subunit 5